MSCHDFGHLVFMGICIADADIGLIGMVDFDEMGQNLAENALCALYLVAFVKRQCVRVTWNVIVP